MSLERLDRAGFEAEAEEWDRIAAGSASPYLTSAWLTSWWRAFGADDGVALVLRGAGGGLRAGACLSEPRGGVLRIAGNEHTNDWGAIAVDEADRTELWTELAAAGYRDVALEPLLADGEAAAKALAAAGYRLVEEEREASPWIELPGSLEELLAERSRNLRSQVGRRRRNLEAEGELRFRAVTGGPELEPALDAFFELEAAGWKGEEGTGTAIAADPRLVELYREFAAAASAQGWLRLYVLELNQKLVAADYGCVFDGCGYLVKTAFDEDLGSFAPGLVLRAAVIDASIEEGLSRYDFLGGPDPYKMRWADRLRERSALYAWSGIGAIPRHAWRKHVRPGLKSLRDAVGRRQESGARSATT